MTSLATMHVELAGISSRMVAGQHHAPRPVVPLNTDTAPEILPRFSAGPLVSAMNGVATDMQLSFDEMSYTLDSSATTPFRKYRITLTAGAGYAELRKFIPAVSRALPHVDLDSIRCTRQDLSAATIACELTFSAYYRKDDDE